MEGAIFVSEQDSRIYVADLADYNAGRLRGVWITLNDFVLGYEVLEAIADFLATADEPGHEEWAVHDYDGEWLGPLASQLGEWPDMDELVDLADRLDEYGQAFADYVENVGLDSASEDDFTDSYCGQYDSGADYAAELADELGVGGGLEQSWPFTCVDWDQAWRELTYDGYWISNNGHVFSK